MGLKLKRKSHDQLPEVNVIPLIDVALMLLLVFMVTTPMLHQGIKVELPKGKAQETRSLDEDLVVHIDKSNNLFFGGQPTTVVKLEQQLKTGIKGDKTVFVKGDRGVSYGTVIELVDRIKQIEGIKYVALATERKA